MNTKGQMNRDKVYEAIDRNWKAKYCTPAIREIGKASGIGSTAVVVNALKGLVKEGRCVYVGIAGNRHVVPMWVMGAVDQWVSLQELVQGEPIQVSEILKDNQDFIAKSFAVVDDEPT